MDQTCQKHSSDEIVTFALAEFGQQVTVSDSFGTHVLNQNEIVAHNSLLILMSAFLSSNSLSVSNLQGAINKFPD
jgi:hypothetical protein